MGVKFYHANVCWVPVESESIPRFAMRGVDEEFNVQYIARAWHEGDLLPGKLDVEDDLCHVSHNCQEHVKQKFEVLLHLSTTWVKSRAGSEFPVTSAIPGGHTIGGEVLYIGRVEHHGVLQLGKIHLSHGVCYFPFNGEELNSKNFEVLTFRS